MFDPRLEVEPRFPASLQLATVLRAVAWIVTSLAVIAVLTIVLRGAEAPGVLAIAVAVACYAILNHIVMYAAAEALVIAVAVEQNTRLTAVLLKAQIEGGAGLNVAAGAKEGDQIQEAMKGLAAVDPHEREAAIVFLGQLGTKAKDSIPALEEALQDSDRRVHTRAQWALGEIRRGS